MFRTNTELPQEDLRDFLPALGNEIPIFTSNEQISCLTGTIQT